MGNSTWYQSFVERAAIEASLKDCGWTHLCKKNNFNRVAALEKRRNTANEEGDLVRPSATRKRDRKRSVRGRGYEEIRPR